MILIGIILLVLGFLLGFHLLWILGIAALVIGLILVLAGMLGHPLGGRAHWF